MKITVTGAAGRLGRAVVKALHAAGHQVAATDQCFTRELPVGVEVLNLLDADGCYRVLAGSEMVVHLGNVPGLNWTKPQRTYADSSVVNVNVFQAALDVGVRRIIYASSIQVVNGSRTRDQRGGTIPPSVLPYLPLDGHVPANPGNLYAAGKVAAENLLAYYAKFHGLSAVSLRFPVLLAPDDAKYTLTQVQRQGLLDEGFSCLAMPDAAELVAAVAAVELPGFRIYLPAGPGTTLAPQSVEEIVAQYYPQVPRRGQSEYDNLVDISEITRETGWRPKVRLVPASPGIDRATS